MRGYELYGLLTAGLWESDFLAQIFSADLLSIKTVSGAKLGWRR
jgi:hypothetical protein